MEADMRVHSIGLMTWLAGGLCVLAGEPAVLAGGQTTPLGSRAGGLQQLLPDHYVYLHTDSTPGVSSTFNSGVIVTSEGVVVVDALSSVAIARRVREAIGRVTAQPVRVLVSSTFHGRFTGGNAVYQDVLNIGHEHYRADLAHLLKAASPEERAARLPDQIFRGRVTLHLGGKEIQVLHLGRGHTRGDSIVFVPGDRIAYLSEVFNHDEFPYSVDGFPGEWLKTLEAAEKLEADIFVPAHGFVPANPRETRQGLARHRQILLDVQQAVQKEIARGATEDQAVANIDLPQYHHFQGYSQAMRMAVRRTYQELTGRLD
jgi:glyoxylase-like metal-dependent hydrolase (beta-lactamase superfamily II)